MKIEKKENKIYTELKQAKKKHKNLKLPQLVDRWQYIYSSEKGKISLIKLVNYFYTGHNFFEIFCLEGHLLEDTERFKFKKDAVKRIKELLA